MLLNKENSDDFFSEFLRSDMGLLKLRTLLLCRSCKDLCIEPFSSDFCQHLSCENCLIQKKIRHSSCKWCRNPEDMVADFQSKVLIASYKKLCAILRDFITGYVNDETGPSTVIKNKLMRFLDEGCSLPDIPIHDVSKTSKIEKKKPNRKLSKAIQANITQVTKTEDSPCPPCCCTCANGDLNFVKLNPPNDETELVPQTSKNSSHKNLYDNSPDYRSDTVSSTVPDAAPVISSVKPELNIKNKYGEGQNEGFSSEDNVEHVVIKTEPDLTYESNDRNDQVRESSVKPCEFYDALSSISLKERKNRNIFEKFGLELSPTPNKIENEPTIKIKSVDKHRRKLKKNKDKKKKHIYQVKQKLQPLKLKVRKINSYNSDGYSVQYNISNENENSEQDNFVIQKENDTSSDAVTVSDSNEPDARKVKRKATFVSNYAVFSDESDFESGFYTNKRTPKVNSKKDRGEVCSCGSGNHVKYFTNICKRSRCPCFSQGRSCANCKCKFCSNPYLSENQTEDAMFTDSDSGNEPPQLTYWAKDETEVVDVESM